MQNPPFARGARRLPTPPLFVAALVTLIAAAAAPGAAPKTVAGKVFLDANGNGTLDAGEKGLAGVRVTDGNVFAVAGEDGLYSIDIADDVHIPYAPARVVSLSWPRDTWPTGRWWRRLSEIRDAAGVNFGLRRETQTLPFAYLHVTDAHGGAAGYQGLARWSNRFPEIKFVVNTGDLGYAGPDNTDAMFQAVVRGQSHWKVPVFNVQGNHDFVGQDWDRQADQYGHGGYTKYLGPIRWSFRYADIHFCGVDWIRRIGTTGGEGNRGYELRTPDQAVEWLRRDWAPLGDGARIVLFDHFPTGTVGFHKLLQQRRVEMVHGGHNHAHAWYFYGAPMLTAVNCKGPGMGNVIIAHRDGIDTGAVCLNGRHGRRCPLGWWGHFMSGKINARTTGTKTREAARVAGDGAPVAVGTEAVFVSARIALGGARAAGVKIGPKQSAVSVAFDGSHMRVNGVRVPLRAEKKDAPLTCRILVEGNKLTLWADDRLFFEKRIAPRKATRVVPFAEGAATFQSLSVRELKPDGNPGERYERCACAHGTILKQYPLDLPRRVR